MPSQKASKRLRKELMANQIQPPAQSQQQEIAQHIHQELMYSGPIPAPETLEGYKKTDPSYPERIMKMAEAHNAADVTAKNRISLSDLITPLIGQVFTLILGAGGILACIYLAMAGYTLPAIVAVVGGFSPVAAGAFKTIRRR